MDVDRIFSEFNRTQVDWILIGGMNYLLNHEPELTFDVDLWIRDDPSNLARTAAALVALDASWGRDEYSWNPVVSDPSWLQSQSLFCLTSPYGAIDVFRKVRGLENQFDHCLLESSPQKTAAGTPYHSLSDRHMLACQMALPEGLRKAGRVATLLRKLQENP